MIIKRKVFAIIIYVIIFAAANSFAQEMAISPNVQANLFKKIFSFNKTLASKESVEVAVLSGSGSGDAMVAAFKQAGVSAKAVSGDQVPAGVSVVYIMPGVTPQKQQYASKGVLSICGSSINVEDGKIAIGLGLEGEKPKIIVHMGQLKAEGQELSSDVLKMAYVIK
ncbi:hypothetical protein C0389_06305 [bacterium]|nr:hypothetical protein [bacterium]